MTAADKTALPTSVGFIGLGAMGRPMVSNLAKKLPPGSKIHVYDVVAAEIEEVCSLFPSIVIKCANAKEVTERSVSGTCLRSSSVHTSRT